MSLSSNSIYFHFNGYIQTRILKNSVPIVSNCLARVKKSNNLNISVNEGGTRRGMINSAVKANLNTLFILSGPGPIHCQMYPSTVAHIVKQLRS